MPSAYHRAFLVLLVLLSLAASANAAGLLVPRDGSPPIAVQSHRVMALLEDGLARTTLRQTFVNPHNRALEAIYVFPLPEDAALVNVAMEVGGKRLEGLLVERKRARKIYDDIVRSNRDPALVEKIGRGKFRLSVFPVLPNKETVIELTWIQQVRLTQGVYRYVYPLHLAEGKSKTEQDFTFALRIQASVPLASVKSPFADMALDQKGPSEIIASFERTETPLDRDVVIEASIEVEDPTLSVTSFKPEKGDGFFLAVVTPPKAKAKHLIPRDVILLIDTSGSMGGSKIEQARRSALHLLHSLRPEDRVNVIKFSSSLESFAEAPVPALPENLMKLRKFIELIEAGGGTALGDALQAAMAGPPAEDRVRTVVLLTDGRPTMGVTSPSKIVSYARDGAKSGLRVFSFGVGEDVNPALLEGISKASRGKAEIFKPEEQIEGRLGRFMDRIASPVIANIKASIEGAHIRDVFPRPVPDAYLGEQVILAGRYREGGKRKLVLSATVGTVKSSLEKDIVLRTDAGGSTSIRQLFAQEKLTFLEGILRLRSGLSDEAFYAAVDRGAYSTQNEIVDEMINVSLECGVHCAYTSFLVLLPEDRQRINPRDADAIAKAMERARKAKSDAAPASEDDEGAEPAPAVDPTAEGPKSETKETQPDPGFLGNGGPSATPPPPPAAGSAPSTPPGGGDSGGAGGGEGSGGGEGGGEGDRPPPSDGGGGSGGAHRGPAGDVPPGDRHPNDPPPAGDPAPAGGSAESPDSEPPAENPGASPGDPGTFGPSGGPSPGGIAGPGGKKRLRAKAMTFENWLFWWGYNRDGILHRRLALSGRAMPPTAAPATIAALRKTVLDERLNREIRGQAALALARVAGPVELPTVLKAATSKNPRLAVPALLGLGVLGGKDAGTRARLLRLLETGNRRTPIRCAALITLGLKRDNDPAVLKYLKTLLNRNEPTNDVPVAALFALGLIGDNSIQPELIDWLLHGKIGRQRVGDLERAWIVDALGRTGDPAAAKPIARELHRKGRYARRSAVLALGRLIPSLPSSDRLRYAQMLAHFARTEGDLTARNFTEVTLGRIAAAESTDEKTRKAVVSFLLDEYEKVSATTERPYVALGLGLAASTAEVTQREKIIGKLRDTLKADKGDRIALGAVVLALGFAGDRNPQTVESLEAILADRGSDWTLRSAAAMALGLIGQGRDTVIGALTERNNRDLLVETATASCLLGDPRAVSPLLATLRSSKASVFHMSSAALALGQLKDPAATGPLLTLFESDKVSDLTRAMAAQALGHLLDQSGENPLWRLTEDLNYRALPADLAGVLTWQ